MKNSILILNLKCLIISLSFGIFNAYPTLASESVKHYHPKHTVKDIFEGFHSHGSRGDFERQHGLNNYEASFEDDKNPKDPRQILLLPFDFKNLRQMMQLLFLLASDYQIATMENPSDDEKLDWIKRISTSYFDK